MHPAIPVRHGGCVAAGTTVPAWTTENRRSAEVELLAGGDSPPAFEFVISVS